MADEIERLNGLRNSGVLSDEEFTEAKAKLLRGDEPQPSRSDSRSTDGLSENQWAMALHLSLLAGYAVPLAGFVVPIAIWQIKKDHYPIIDEHGKNAVNWIISSTLYVILSVILVFVAIGIVGLIVLSVLAVVFPIVAAIKANNGEVWKYPGAISFF